MNEETISRFIRYMSEEYWDKNFRIELFTIDPFLQETNFTIGSNARL